MTAPSHIAPQLTLCLAITRRLRAYSLNQLAPACSGSSHSDIAVSGREVFGKEGVLFRQIGRCMWLFLAESEAV